MLKAVTAVVMNFGFGMVKAVGISCGTGFMGAACPGRFSSQTGKIRVPIFSGWGLLSNRR
jgi:hypothetical protein